MKNVTLAERIEDDDKIIIKYSFGDIKLAYHYAHDTTPSLSFNGEWILNFHISPYDKIRLMSGIEEFAREALQEYYNNMCRHIEKFKI